MSTDQLTTEQLSRTSRKPASTSGFSLLVVRDDTSSTYPLPEQGRLLIGRATHAELRIDHGSVSREHAVLHVGPEISIEDLGSANGTRVRDVMLPPEKRVPVRPHDVIDLGRVLLVVQPRGLEQRLRRVCAPAFFELRVEEECERAELRPFAVAHLEVHGESGLHAVDLFLASELSERDLVTSPSAGRYDLLLLDAEPVEARRRLDRALALLRDRGLRIVEKLSCAPRDGSTAAALLERGVASTLPSSRSQASAGLVVADPVMLRVIRLLERIAVSDLSVLLLGETGVGKEMCAELVHASSARSPGKLLRLNCAAVPEALLESELFGYERGAFTGATTEKPGLLELATGGSVFLDEVGDMPLSTQVKLLRVIESKELSRLGARGSRRIDVRVIAATNRDLQEQITAGLFREDLYYRLNGISVIVPPLRERPRDIEPLVRHFVASYAHGGRPVPRVSPRSLAWLEQQRWPGNVRQLKNAIERALVLCDAELLEPVHLQHEAEQSSNRSSLPAVRGLRAEVSTLERARIEQALQESGGNQRRAAELLGISRGALLRRLQQLGFSRPRKGV